MFINNIIMDQKEETPYKPLEFWFNTDPNMSLPLVCKYNQLKEKGVISKDMTYAEFEKICCYDGTTTIKDIYL